jgi:AcrR family transcriptional regulator
MAMAERAPERRTQAERRSASEEALIRAAAELIAERGIAGASLASIGERAGTSRGLPTHHFGSKDVLVARVAQHAQDRLEAAAISSLERTQRIDEAGALERVRTMVATYLTLFEHPSPEVRALIVMWGATFPAESSIDGMLEADQRGYRGWADLIMRGQHDGSIRSDVDPIGTAVLLLGFLRGVAALVLTESSIVDMSNIRAICDDWITAALAGTPPASATSQWAVELGEDSRNAAEADGPPGPSSTSPSPRRNRGS